MQLYAALVQNPSVSDTFSQVPKFAELSVHDAEVELAPVVWWPSIDAGGTGLEHRPGN